METNDIIQTGFLLRCEQVEAWRDGLTAEQAGQLVFASLDFVQDGVEPEFSDGAVKMAWKLLKGTLIRDKQAYRKKAEENQDKALEAEIKRLKKRKKVKSEYSALITAEQEPMPGENDNAAEQELMPGQPYTNATTETSPESETFATTFPTTSAAAGTWAGTNSGGIWLPEEVRAAQRETQIFFDVEVAKKIREILDAGFSEISVAQIIKDAGLRAKKNPTGYICKALDTWQRNRKNVLNKD